MRRIDDQERLGDGVDGNDAGLNPCRSQCHPGLVEMKRQQTQCRRIYGGPVTIVNGEGGEGIAPLAALAQGQPS